MVESLPQMKNDEQFPLLMVNAGGDGGGGRRQPATVVSSVWNVTSCTPKNSWKDHWPEFLSACWMTFILLGISFLVFYAIAMVAYKQQSFIVVKCNNSKPASDVYYHCIIQHANSVPIVGYSAYLTHMATQYPLLRFNIFFLVDDTLQGAYSASRLSPFYSKLMPFHPAKLHDEYNKREMKRFQKRFTNVNITIMPLSQYMAMTPLKYKWKSIPVSYLLFYARIFSVWENGGIGMDLSIYNNRFINNYQTDERLTEILKQHNNGVKEKSYADAFNKIKREEENEFILIFNTLINHILNDTRSFFNRSIPFYQSGKEKETAVNEPLIRTHRNKRDVSDLLAANITDFKVRETSSSSSSAMPSSLPSKDILDTTNTTNKKEDTAYTFTTENTNMTVMTTNSSTPVNHNKTDFDWLNILMKSDGDTEQANKSEVAQIVFMYDVSVISGSGSYLIPPPAQNDMGQVNPISEFKSSSNVEIKNSVKPIEQTPQLLMIESSGLFIASNSPLHPFLTNILSAGCRRAHPRYAIQDTLYSQCSSAFKNDVYCNNIYVL